METRRSSKGYECDKVGSGNSSSSSDSGGILKRAVGTTVAGAVVGGPLVVGMGITLALTVSLGVIGIPLMLIFSPLLIIPCFILGTAIAGFSVAALLALAGISTLNSVFPHHSYSFHVSGPKTAADDNKELKQEHPRQETIEEDQETRVPTSSIVSPATADKGEKEEEEEGKDSNVTVTNKEKEEEGEELEEEQEEGENETTAAPSSQTLPHQPESATSTHTAADTSQKKQPSQKSKKQKPKK